MYIYIHIHMYIQQLRVTQLTIEQRSAVSLYTYLYRYR